MDNVIARIAVWFTLALSTYADPNFKEIFRQTTKEANNEVLSNITGKVPEWLSGDFVRQNCASYGEIDGRLFKIDRFAMQVIYNH